jgi:hypothetical protein
MKIQTHIGLLDINPAVVASIRPAFEIPEKGSFKDLFYRIDFKDGLCIARHHAVSISEADAVKLSELSGIKIPGREAHGKGIQKALFVPFKKLLVLNDWEKAFDNSLKPEVSPA